MKLSFGGVIGIAGLLLIGGFLLYLYANRKSIVAAVNPVDANNLANKAVTSAVSAATGRDETLGGFIYDLTHPDPTLLPSTANPFPASPL